MIIVTRRPQAIQIESLNLKIIKADISNQQALQDAIEGADVVISVLGFSSLLQARKGTKIYSEGTKAILKPYNKLAVID